MQQLQLDLTTFDLSVAVAYLVVVILQGLYAAFGKENASAYFLGKRELPWYLVGFSLFATSLSGVGFVGLLAASYLYGLATFSVEWVAILLLLFIAFFVLPSFLQTGLQTVPAFLEGRFDRRSRVLYALGSILLILALEVTGGLYLGGKALTLFFPAISLDQAVFLLAVAAGTYTVAGGLSSVVATHTLQALLMLLGIGVLLFFGLNHVGGWNSLLDQVDRAQLDLFKPTAEGFLPWSGLLGLLLLAFHRWGLNQQMAQFPLASRNLDQARKGMLFAGFLLLPSFFILAILGLGATLIYPAAAPEQVFSLLAYKLPPIGFRGLLLAAFIAAVMSTLDAAFHAISSLFALDLVQPIRPTIKAHRLARIGRLTALIVVVIGALCAPQVVRFGAFFDYAQGVLAYFVPPVVAVYLGGLFWRRINESAAFWTLLTGLLGGAALFIAKEVLPLWDRVGLPDFHYTYMASFLFVASLLLLWGISAVTYRPLLLDIRPYLYSEESYRTGIQKTGAAFYRDFRSYAFLLLLLSFGFLLYLSL
jgi:SSS family solute:Na+ symporter